MSKKRSFEEAVEGALEWVAQSIVAEEGFSLLGLALDHEGQLQGLKINAEDDAQMISQARRALEMSKAVAFCLVGTGQLMEPGEGPIDVLIVYTQEEGDRFTVCRYASYDVYEEQGRPVFAMSDWVGDPDEIEPWLGRV